MNEEAIAERRAYELSLHQRHCAGHSDASYDLVSYFKPLLERALTGTGLTPDVELIEGCALQALTEYLVAPTRFDPARSSLWTWLVRAAKGDLLNHLGSERRKKAVAERYENEVALASSDRNSVWMDLLAAMGEVEWPLPKDLSVSDLIRRLELSLRPSDRRVMWMMLEPRTPTSEYAEVLGLGLLPAKEQAKQVKDAKDRVRRVWARVGEELKHG